MSNFVKDKYDKFYKSIHFERLGLFELIKKELNPQSVLYPGCSIHVTPSFYFKNVVYVDKNQLTIDFFKNVTEVTNLINENKTFKESSYWKYVPKDFQFDLGLKDYSFDLLISLFGGKLIDYCERYIKSGGLILTNSHFSDNDSIKNNDDYKLLGLIRCVNFKYRIDYDNKNNKLRPSRLRPTNEGFEYVDNEEYYIYKRIKKQYLTKAQLAEKVGTTKNCR